MFARLGKNIMPEKFRKNIKKYLEKTGKYEVPYSKYGTLFVLTILISISVFYFLFFKSINSANPVMFVLFTFLILTVTELILVVVSIFGLWIYYEFVIFNRTREIEAVLPDFLEEVSVNLRAGMSFDKALWNSIEPQFGVLEKEIQIVAKKVMSGYDTEEALKEFSKKYESTLLQESMDMIVVGLKSGGNVAELIDKIVKNVKDAYYLNKELIASVTSYVIFISVIAIVISPILFALSFNLMQVIQSLGEKMTTSSSYGIVSISFDNKLDPNDFILFSKIAVTIIASMSSIIIADLREGSIKAGIKYILLFLPISYIIYVVMLALFTGIFGTMG